MTETERIAKALEIAAEWSDVGGAGHKQWVIDQMVRALTDEPTTAKTSTDYLERSFALPAPGESVRYEEFIAEVERDDGQWDEGITP